MYRIPGGVPILVGLAAILACGGRVEAQGVEFAAAYTGDGFYNASGGLRQAGALLHNVDLVLDLAGAEALGLPGFEARVYVLANEGRALTEIVGEWQTTSNIEAPAAVRLYEAWVQQSWASDWSLLFGLYDLNSEFYVSEAGTLFINSAHGIGPELGASGVTGPSIFPVTSLAARLRWERGPGYARFAILDGVPGHPEDESSFVHIDLGPDDGALLIGEAGFAEGGAARKVAVGVWSYTRDFPDAVDAEVTHEGTFGFYLLGETMLWGDLGGRSIVGFGRVGHADPDVHPVSWSWGSGLVLRGVLGPDRGDQLGAAVTAGSHASRYLEAAGTAVDRRETAFELTYSVELSPRLRLQPDIQYILDPGMDPALDHALLFGLRVELGF